MCSSLVTVHYSRSTLLSDYVNLASPVLLLPKNKMTSLVTTMDRGSQIDSYKDWRSQCLASNAFWATLVSHHLEKFQCTFSQSRPIEKGNSIPVRTYWKWCQWKEILNAGNSLVGWLIIIAHRSRKLICLSVPTPIWPRTKIWAATVQKHYSARSDFARGSFLVSFMMLDDST